MARKRWISRKKGKIVGRRRWAAGGHHHRPASILKPFSSQRALRELSVGASLANWAPAVNRQPGLRQEPRRALLTRESAESRRRELLEAFLKKLNIHFFHVDIKLVPPNVLIVKVRLQSSY